MIKNLLFFFIVTTLSSTPITDYSKIYRGETTLLTPYTTEELQSIVKTNPRIAITGGNYSMGGHTWCNNGISIDMKHFNKVLALDITHKTVTVQAGARWKDVQAFLLPCNLTIKVMQSYNDFSVGGSLSVNVHGRDPYGSLITTVHSLRLMLADGSIIETSRTKNPELFKAVIGGYGACGIILDVTLELEDNYKIKKVIKETSIQEFPHFYQNTVKDNPDIAFFNGNMYPPHFNTVINFCWLKSEESLTNTNYMQNYQPNIIKNSIGKNLEFSAVHFPSLQKIRLNKDIKNGSQKEVVWRSYEMSYAVNSLAPHWTYASKILQEYFIPVKHFEPFVKEMKKIIWENNVKMLNISIRYVHKNTESYLTYAPDDCFAFVCYIVLLRTEPDIARAKQWTQKLIDAALKYQGSYYLPYHRFARHDQLLKAYPHYPEFFSVKNQYDPQGKFQNNVLRFFETGL